MMSANDELTSLYPLKHCRLRVTTQTARHMLLSLSSEHAERGLRHNKGSGFADVSFEV